MKFLQHPHRKLSYLPVLLVHPPALKPECPHHQPRPNFVNPNDNIVRIVKGRQILHVTGLLLVPFDRELEPFVCIQEIVGHLHVHPAEMARSGMHRGYGIVDYPREHGGGDIELRPIEGYLEEDVGVRDLKGNRLMEAF